MAALSVNPLSPVALSALRSVQPPTVPPARTEPSPGTSSLSLQDLAQTLFQRTLQATTLFPLAAPATRNASLAQATAAALLASLNAPQATTVASTVTTTTTNPVAAQPVDTTPSTAPASAPTAAVIGDLPAGQDAFALSLGPDFAMQTALRFGAGVQSQAALALPPTDLGAELVRDAANVLRLGNLQPQAGGPGPEAFATQQNLIQRVLRSYGAAPTGTALQGTDTVDLLA